MAVVNGVAAWASVQAPNTTYEPEYSIDVTVSKEDAKELRDKGLTVKEKDGQLVIKFKRSQFRKDGAENPKPKVIDADAMPFTDLIGNGSIVNVQYRTYPWTYAGKSGISADLVGVQVVDLVEFGGNELQPIKSTDTDHKVPVNVTNTNNNINEEDPFDE